jgi:DNA-binding transcriptional LysR family regulator
MDIRHLKYFLAAAEELNIGRAAARLHISQPPLTRQIRSLEKNLGVDLFVRTAKGVELTQAGEMFREEAANVIMLFEAGIDRVQRAGEGKLGRLDVGIFGSAIYDVIPRLLQDFRTKLPGVNIVLHTMNKSEQIEALRQRRITVGFNRMTPPMPDIGRELVLTERLFAVLEKSHPLVGLKAVPFRALAEHPLVLFPNVGRPNFVDRVIELCKLQGFEPTIAQEVGDAVTGIALVARGFGITLVPESAATSLQIEGTVYRPFADAPHATVDLSVLYRANDHSPLLKSFLAVVREYRAAHGIGMPAVA